MASTQHITNSPIVRKTFKLSAKSPATLDLLLLSIPIEVDIIIMKVSASAVLALSLLPSTGAFVSTVKTTSAPSVSSQLNLQADKWAGPAATAIAGLTLASQMAGAAPVQSVDAVNNVPPMIQQGRKIGTLLRDSAFFRFS